MEQQAVSDVTQAPRGNADDQDYDAFLARTRQRFLKNIGDGKGPIFTTDTTGLWEAYLANFAVEERQHHNCRACESFIKHYGGLVVVSSIGLTTPIMWNTDDAPPLYKHAIEALEERVRRARVTGPFLTEAQYWGQGTTGVWRHFSLTSYPWMKFDERALTAGQAMAAKREDFKTVLRALQEFTPATLDQALTLLRSEALYRSEKVIGPAQWLRDLHSARENLRGAPRENVTWLAIAQAPDGFCHPRASMIGTLLEDIEAGRDFAEVSRRFAAKMNPTQYQRPQAAPTAGNIAAAEKLVEKLGIAPALARRYARLDELETLWKPAPPAVPATGGGVFAHLKPKGSETPEPMKVPPQVITWEKFARTVLPSAQTIEAYAPSTGTYAALVTAEHADAPPILQWDRLDQRNPMAWYLCSDPSPAARWSLMPRTWVPVTAVSLQPTQWHGADLPHHGEGVFLILEGAKDNERGHGGLFPENLRSELHGVRSTIEAHAKSAAPTGSEDASACGLKLKKGGIAEAHLRVTLSGGTVAEYKVDRFD